MSETQNRISDERLAAIVNAGTNCFKICVPAEGEKLARELKALRASHKRLVEALQSCTNNLNMARLIMPADARKQTAELIAEYRAVLADARKLEGK